MSLVSIIMPAYNSESYIKESINSVIQQTYKTWELIIIDDCSADNTISIVNSFKDERIKIIRNQKNIGAAKSRNRGIQIASGRFIAFLDSDDLWHETKLEIQICFIEENNLPFCYSAYIKINELGEKIKKISIPEQINRNKLLKTCYIGCLTAIYDCEKLGKISMPTDTLREDYATWLKIIKKTKYLRGINKPLAYYRIHKNQSSKKKLKMAHENWKIYRNQEGLSIIESLYFFFNYSIRGLIRSNSFDL